VIRLLATLLVFAAAAAAQDNSGVPADIQATVDRIRSEMRLPDSAPATAPAEAAHQPVPPITPEELEADSEDSAILLRTMRPVTVDDLATSAALRDAAELDAREMLDAAERLAERGDKEARRIDNLVAQGAASADAAASAREEAARRHNTLDLVTDRAAMLAELIEMARADEIGPGGARRSSSGTLRYDGSGRLIRPAELATLSASFQKRFAKPLPISAWGETAMHAMLGFDHHGRVDVAVNPDGPEGRWVRAWLERARIPYYGFRTALLGRSTGPHIHIGPGSVRVRTLSRRTARRPTAD
jgi:murein DD-endopeptidase MepM/ murein hydrolase activator NlpD